MFPGLSDSWIRAESFPELSGRRGQWPSFGHISLCVDNTLTSSRTPQPQLPWRISCLLLPGWGKGRAHLCGVGKDLCFCCGLSSKAWSQFHLHHNVISASAFSGLQVTTHVPASSYKEYCCCLLSHPHCICGQFHARGIFRGKSNCVLNWPF